jgi:hypothetical protein
LVDPYLLVPAKEGHKVVEEPVLVGVDQFEHQTDGGGGNEDWKKESSTEEFKEPLTAVHQNRKNNRNPYLKEEYKNHHNKGIPQGYPDHMILEKLDIIGKADEGLLWGKIPS